MPTHRGAKPETDRTPQKTITMADAAFITPSAEMLPIISGTPVVAASTASGGIFAGMLAQRFQPSVKGETVDTAERPTLPAGNLPSGQSSPQDGNTLPPTAPVSAVFDGGSEALSVMLDPLSDTRPAQATARPDVPLQDLLTQVRDVPDASAVLPVGVIPPLAPLPDAKLQPLSEDRPVPADERYSQPGRVPSPVALSLAGLMGAQPEARLARPASLGLNVRGETAEMLRIAIAPLSAEQTARGGMAAQLTNQALSGESLSRPFQQQIDHLLAMSRSPIISAGPSMTLLAPSDTAASIIPADLSLSAFLPGGGSDVRAGVLTGLGSLSGLPVNTPMGQPGWSAELSQRMVWLANREIREAQIQLNPRH
ncbi:hypothetical protein MNBD_GAMMA20-1652, partial [hydrothermal vent metagenome]